jgi:hypothetical protein
LNNQAAVSESHLNPLDNQAAVSESRLKPLSKV